VAQTHTHGGPSGGGGGDDTGRREVAQEQGREVADDARQQAGHVAETARQEGAKVADEIKHHAIDLAEDAREQLHHQARQQTSNLGQALGQFGGRVHALADGRPEEAGPVGDYADRLAGQVEDIAGRIDELGFDGVVDEVQRFARRRPGAFLAGAAFAGFAVARLTRGGRDAEQGSADSGRTRPTATGAERPMPGAPPSGTYAGSPERRATPMPVDTPTPGVGGVPPVQTPTTDPMSSGQVNR
jgi:hypothetical protein